MAASIKANCRKVICIGRNYADHITELSSARPSQPFFFLKPPSSILLPKDGPINIPRGVNVHHEIELALVIGPTPHNAPLKNLSESHLRSNPQSLTSLFSHYLLSIDLTARNVQNEAKKKGLPWSISKGFDTFLPISDAIPLSAIPDLHDMVLYLNINGQTKQRDSTELMLFDVPRMLADISRVMALEEGDMVLTGTPKGVGPVEDGDHVECGIEVGGKLVEESRISVKAEADRSEDGYVFRET